MTIQEIRQKNEHLFRWAEQVFKERCAEPDKEGDPMEAAMLMEAILASLTAIHMAEREIRTESQL